MRFIQRISVFFILFAVLAGYQNCADITLIPISQSVSASSSGNVCTSAPKGVGLNTKFVFVVDVSGSNGTTDPMDVRTTSITDFYTQNAAEPNFFWSIITFNQGSTARVTGPGGQATFTKDDAIIQSAIGTTGAANGNTGYAGALSAAFDLIRNDVYATDGFDNYMIFFLSDGEPTDGLGKEEYLTQIRDGKKIGRIFLSTVYYGPDFAQTGNPSHAAAEDLLKDMAAEGEGTFSKLNVSLGNTAIDFNQLFVKPSKEPWQLKRSNMLVYNLTSTVCEDGSIGGDSDVDGLCDKDEVNYGFDPSKRFSVDGGYSDYFRWREVRFGEVLPFCEDRLDEDHDLLTTCEETYLRNRNPIGTDRTTGDRQNPDTDGDTFIDGIELFVFREKSAPLDSSNVSKSLDNEPEDAGTQIAEHRNPKLFDPDAFRYDTQITPTGVGPGGESCYNFEQSRLELFGTRAVNTQDTLPELAHGLGENLILIYYIQTPESDPLGKGVYRYSIQRLQVGSKTESTGSLLINDSVFREYKIPKF